MEHIIYRWLPDPVQMEPDLELPQFRLVNHTLNDCSQNYTTGLSAFNELLLTI